MKLPFIAAGLAIAFLAGCGQASENHTHQDMATDTITSQAPSFRNGYSEVNGINMYYEVYGEGKPLVLIHGGGSTIQTTFARAIPGLARNRQVIGVELQAHGRTSDRDTLLSFVQDAEDVVALLKNLNIAKADFLGFSNGGNTTMQIAIRHPEVADRIIIASSIYKRNGTFPGFWDFMKNGTLADMPQSLKDEFLRVTPDTAKLRNLFEKCAERMLGFKDWDDAQLRSIQAPTLIVTGDNDVGTPEHAVAMFRLIPNCKLMILPGGHGEFMGETSFQNTDRNVASFVLLVEEFLE